MVRLGDVSEIRRGRVFPQKANQSKLKINRIPVISPKDMTSSSTSIRSIYRTLQSISTHELVDKNEQILPVGAVLLPIFGFKSKFENIAIARVPLIPSQHFVSIVACEDIEPRYLAWYLYHILQQMTQEQRFTRSNNLQLRLLKNLPIVLRPLPEQRNIADILDSTDELRSLQNNSSTILQDTFQSAFLQIFGNPAASSSPWPSLPLREVCEIVPPARVEFENSLSTESKTRRFMLRNAINRGNYVIDTSFGAQPPLGTHPNSRELPSGTILFTTNIPYGHVAISSEPTRLFQDTIGIVCNTSVNSWYIFAWLTFAKPYIQSLRQKRKFSTKILGDVDVPVPPMEHQRRFSELCEYFNRVQTKIEKSSQYLQRIIEGVCVHHLRNDTTNYASTTLKEMPKL